ncbi:hypothetical protein Pcinc_031894 [Petrolisthes cinctipes]|uniref:Uncharacterized protein n=1 Tax=Petrolisthes cinctipes TaxID=88211 RepID=A0AAE1EVY0_PETCI|nr:hypothetical protein Pcinc_031894 [Petrolisthes cinctipes]
MLVEEVAGCSPVLVVVVQGSGCGRRLSPMMEGGGGGGRMGLMFPQGRHEAAGEIYPLPPLLLPTSRQGGHDPPRAAGGQPLLDLRSGVAGAGRARTQE